MLWCVAAVESNLSAYGQTLHIARSLIMGLADSEIQKDVLSHPDADEMDLEKLLKFIEGKESGLASQGLMSRGTSVNALKPGQRKNRNCRNCGDSHAYGREHCKATGQTCEGCGKRRSSVRSALK